MRFKEFVDEEMIDEMPLPADWDPNAYGPKSTFASRLRYALERAKRIGTGSSRVAMIIEYQGRPTVLKIAKNRKGLAQNQVEADVLRDGYASQLGILIPMIDYDNNNPKPLWLHTELAQRASEKQLCALLKCDNLRQLVKAAASIAGITHFPYPFRQDLMNTGHSEEDIDIFIDYANNLADLATSFDIKLGDFARRANWGIYQGHPIILDVGFNGEVMNTYYTR